MYGEVMAVSYVDNNQNIKFNKIREQESSRMATVLRNTPSDERDPHIGNY